MLVRLSVALLMGLAVAGCGHKQCEPCKTEDDCASGLECPDNDHLCKPPLPQSGEPIMCPAECPGEPCRESGRCGFDPGSHRCIAVNNADCVRLPDCAEKGYCSAFSGRCFPKSDPDCTGSRWCKDLARCHVLLGLCAATRDDECATKKACLEKGECYAVDGRCRARTDEECQRAPSCSTDGTCARTDGYCVVSETACQASANCKAHGACHLSVDSKSCAVRTDEDCKASAECAASHHCHAVGGHCG